MIESQETELPKSYPFLPVSSDYVDAFPVLLKRIQLVQECISTFLTYVICIIVPKKNGFDTSLFIELLHRLLLVFLLCI